MNKAVGKYLNEHKDECSHDFYRSKHYVQLQNMAKGTVWHGKIVSVCKDCGVNISKYRLVEIKTKDEYLRGLEYG